MTDVLFYQRVSKRSPQILPNPALLFNCFDLFLLPLIKGVLCWSGAELSSPPPSLVPLYLAEISVSLWESESDLRPELMERREGGEGWDPQQRRKAGVVVAVARVRRDRSGWDWHGHSVLVDEAARRFPM